MKVAIIGAGTVGKSIAEGIKNDFSVSLSSGSFEKLKKWNNERFQIFDNNVDNAKNAEVILLTIKPGISDSVMEEIQAASRNKLVISFMAGVTLNHMQERLKESHIARAMPSIPMLVQKSVTAYSYKNLDNKEIELMKKILAGFGSYVKVEESNMDAVTGLSGSGPAFVAIMADSMINAGILAGIPRQQATDLVIDTFINTMQLMRERGISASDLRDEVMTPGGTTVTGIYEMEKANVRTAIANAVLGSYRKAQEIGRKN
ncbi:pyrroline-5-carboxylate reductase [Ferroplasma sp.]|uniref:pyrroline-5-carboxylate reductase n=1 Tax=Ferroplasma sp. TaxID=2591003 RepID=UPI00263242ED|nr:pyrroline-5-carboxylate reductase [Ferroplasma sp.]MCL4453598.1 pyrroline-5-carboxylate reductase [Candidatus Thermoplasmatota archaeon]